MRALSPANSATFTTPTNAYAKNTGRSSSTSARPSARAAGIESGTSRLPIAAAT